MDLVAAIVEVNRCREGEFDASALTLTYGYLVSDTMEFVIES